MPIGLKLTVHTGLWKSPENTVSRSRKRQCSVCHSHHHI